MQTGHAILEQAFALLRRVVDSELGDRCVVVTELFESRKVGFEPVGTARLEFRDALTGVFRFDVEGVSGLKNITRMPVE